MNIQSDDVFTQIGGARIGRSYWLSFNATIPFAKFEATETEITLKAFGKTYSFPKVHITDIWLSASIISTGVQIEHCVEKYPRYVVFWTTNVDEIQSNLQRLGYKTR